MECLINIFLRKDVKEDYCMLSREPYEQDLIKADIITNGKEPFDLKKLRYYSLTEDDLCRNFLVYYSKGRDLLSTARKISIVHFDKQEVNTKKQTRELARLISLNGLNKLPIYVDTGYVKLVKEDIDTLTPLLHKKNVYVPFNNYEMMLRPSTIKNAYDVIEEINRRASSHDFSLLEKILYAYDMLKTDMMIDPEYSEKIKSLLSAYAEPSVCYSLLFSQILDRFKVNSLTSIGCFYGSGNNAMNIVRINDPEYDVDGIFYFDMSRDSNQRFLSSLMDFSPEKENEEVINSYVGFCKNKEFMITRAGLEKDFGVGPFSRDFMSIYDATVEKHGLNGLYGLAEMLNNVGYLIDGRTVIDVFNGLSKDDDLEEIRDKVVRYAKLFEGEIDGSDFLEMLFNVRKEEYAECKKLFPLSTDILRECVFKSKFIFPRMNVEFPEDKVFELEDIEGILRDEFDESFDNSADASKIDERIRNLKIILQKEKDKSKENDDNK